MSQPYGPPPSHQPQQPPQPGWGAPTWGGPPAGPPPGSSGPRKPWPLVIGALVAGLVLGAGLGFAISAATAEDPEDSAAYQDLEDDLADARSSLSAEPEPTDPEPTEAEPTEAEPTEALPTEAEPTEAVPTEAPPGTVDVDGWAVTEPQIGPDFIDDYAASFTATNLTGAPAQPSFTLTLLQQGATVVELSCVGGGGIDVEVGESADMTCVSAEDYVEGGWDSTRVETS